MLPRNSSEAKTHRSNHTPILPRIDDNDGGSEVELINGNTICRIIYDAAQRYAGLKAALPSTVFVNLYHYSSRLW